VSGELPGLGVVLGHVARQQVIQSHTQARGVRVQLVLEGGGGMSTTAIIQITCNNMKAFYFVGQKFSCLKTTDIKLFVGIALPTKYTKLKKKPSIFDRCETEA